MVRLNSVGLFDYLLIALYFGIVIWVGFFSARKNQGTKDFFQAGESVPWFLAGISNWVSGFSAFMFIAAAGEIYRNGASAVLLFTSAFFGYLGGYFYFAKAWRRARIAAPMDFLTRRFSPSTTYVYSLCFIPMGIISIGTGLYTISLFVSSALRLDRELLTFLGWSVSGVQLGILLIGLVMVLYSSLGGLWAAVLSDAVQGLIVIVMTVLLLPVSLQHLGSGDLLGGVERMLRELPRDYLIPHTGQRGWLFFAAYAVFNFMLYNAAWHQVQRYNSVPGERAAQKMAMLCAWLALLGPILWILPVMTARAIFPDIAALWPGVKQPEEIAFVSLALLLLPHGMIGFVVAAIISTAMGKANDTFNWLSASVARNVVIPLRARIGARALEDRQEMRVAQGAMVVLGLLGMGVALYIEHWGKGVFSFVLIFSSLVEVPLFAPVLLGLIYRRTPRWSGLLAGMAGFTASLLLGYFDVFPHNHGYERNVFGALGTIVVVFAISAFFFRVDDPRNREILRLDADLRTPLEPSAVAVRNPGLPMYRVIGNIAIGLGFVLSACALLPANPTSSPAINVVAGLALLLIGGLLRRLAGPSVGPA